MTNHATTRGRLLLIPAPLDFGLEQSVPLQTILPNHTLEEAAKLTHWIVENAKTARAYLKRIDAIYPLKAPIQAQNIVELPRSIHKKGDHAEGKASTKGKENKNSPVFDASVLLAPALHDGHDVGLLSEAGMPAVADPGSSVVRAAHQAGLCVEVLNGPVSLLMALAASGLNGQSFAFVGYLPQQDGLRRAQITRLESFAKQTGQAQICIETPYRNAALWQALIETLKPDTWLSISAALSLPTAINRSQTVKEWRKSGSICPADKHTPAVFSFGC